MSQAPNTGMSMIKTGFPDPVKDRKKATVFTGNLPPPIEKADRMKIERDFPTGKLQNVARQISLRALRPKF